MFDLLVDFTTYYYVEISAKKKQKQNVNIRSTTIETYNKIITSMVRSPKKLLLVFEPIFAIFGTL